MAKQQKRSRLSLRSLFGGRKRATPERVELNNSNEALWNDPLVLKAYEQMATPRRKIETTIDDPRWSSDSWIA